MGFRALRVINDDRVAPGAGLRHAPASRHGDHLVRARGRARAQGLDGHRLGDPPRRRAAHERRHRRAPQRVQRVEDRAGALPPDLAPARRSAGIDAGLRAEDVLGATTSAAKLRLVASPRRARRERHDPRRRARSTPGCSTRGEQAELALAAGRARLGARRARQGRRSTAATSARATARRSPTRRRVSRRGRRRRRGARVRSGVGRRRNPRKTRRREDPPAKCMCPSRLRVFLFNPLRFALGLRGCPSREARRGGSRRGGARSPGTRRGGPAGSGRHAPRGRSRWGAHAARRSGRTGAPSGRSRRGATMGASGGDGEQALDERARDEGHVARERERAARRRRAGAARRARRGGRCRAARRRALRGRGARTPSAGADEDDREPRALRGARASARRCVPPPGRRKQALRGARPCARAAPPTKTPRDERSVAITRRSSARSRRTCPASMRAVARGEEGDARRSARGSSPRPTNWLSCRRAASWPAVELAACARTSSRRSIGRACAPPTSRARSGIGSGRASPCIARSSGMPNSANVTMALAGLPGRPRTYARRAAPERERLARLDGDPPEVERRRPRARARGARRRGRRR